MKPFAQLLSALVALALPVPAQGNVHIVALGNPSSADFGTISAAVEAAVDGDLILVRAGRYGCVNVAGKGITLQGEGSPSMEFLSVEGLSVDQSFAVRGFELSSNCGYGSGLSVINCRGRVWVEDIVSTLPFSSTVRASDSDDVVFKNVTTQSRQAHIPGLEVIRSRALVANCDISAFPFATMDGIGMRVEDSRVHVSGGRVAASLQFVTPAIRVVGDTSELTTNGAQLLAFPPKIEVLGGTSKVNLGTSPSFDIESPVRVGEVVTLQLKSDPGDAAWIAFSPGQGAAFEHASFLGMGVLAFPPQTMPLGTVPASGEIVLSASLPALGTSQFQTYYSQAVTLRPDEGFLVGAPSLMVALAPGF